MLRGRSSPAARRMTPLRFAAAMLTEPGLGLAGPSQIARAVGRHRSRVHEYRTRYREGGAVALEVKRRGPAERASSKAMSWHAPRNSSPRTCPTARSPGRLRCPSRRSKELKDGRLVRQQGAGRTFRDGAPPDSACEHAGTRRSGCRVCGRCGETPGARPGADRAAGGSVAAVRHGRVGGQGGRLALPALLGQGLVEVGQQLYGSRSTGTTA